jgi:DNA-binding transcriptional ArsR family regulator
MRKFTRTPKVSYLIERGCPVEVLPTYQVLSDHANNSTGICWPRMETLAAILGRSVRTIQRHLHTLQALGLVEFVQRRRWRGRFSSYTYRVLHFADLIRRKKAASTTGHGGPLEKASPYIPRTRRQKQTPQTPPLSGPEAAKRRREGYEWLFS